MTQLPAHGSAAIGWALVVLGIAGQKGALTGALDAWISTAPSAVTGGLWASTGERREWEEVRREVDDSRVAILDGDGAGQFLFPFSKPVAASLVHGQSDGG